MMARLLLPDHLLKKPSQFIIGRPAAHARAQIVFGHAEEAGPNISVGGQAKPVAMPAEGLADRRNDANLPALIGESPALGRLGTISGGDGLQLETCLEPLQNLATGHD